jgi:hypothetical protein
MAALRKLRSDAGFSLLLLTLSLGLLPSNASAQEVILGNMSWMTGFPATWNAGAPKLVSDGLHYYAVFCGFQGSSSRCSIARKRGDGIEPWVFGPRAFTSIQPATVIIDRKGRLNIFYNDPYIHHLRLDHPSIELGDWTEITIPFNQPTGYMHVSYDAKDDIILLAFAETSSYTTYFGVKYTDANNWGISPMVTPNPSTMLLYARTLRAAGRFFVLFGEHTLNGTNAYYTAAVLFESSTPTGPWTRRELYRVYGANLGVPDQNWVLANDLQADQTGRVRALLHIVELGSGHANPLDGLYVAREEDGYALRFVGNGIEDGFTLYVDPTSNVHLATARGQVEVSPGVFEAGIVWFRSDDRGATWTRSASGYQREVNPAMVDSRSGSMLGPDSRFMASGVNMTTGAYDSVVFAAVALRLDPSMDRYAYQYQEADGTWDYVRVYNDPATDRSYYYFYDYDPDSSFSVTYSYRAGSYYQVYTADSGGSYHYYNSDGYQVTHVAASVVQYWYDDAEDGAQNYIYIYRDPEAQVMWWVIYDFDTAGTYDLTYVYNRGGYAYVEYRYATGHFTRWDNTGFSESQ